MKKSRFPVFFLVLALSGCASEIQITDIHLSVGADCLLLSLTVPNMFLRDLRKTIENGFKVTHTYVIDLYGVRGFWWDEKITRVQVRHGIEYDNLRQVYLVTLSEEKTRTVSLKDCTDAEKLMSKIVDLRVAELHEMTKGKPYQLRIVAQIGRVQPSSLLRSFLSFFPFEALRSGSRTLTFRY